MRPKLKSTWLITLPDYTNIVKSNEVTLNSRHITEKLKTKDTGTKTQKDENLVLQKNR